MPRFPLAFVLFLGAAAALSAGDAARRAGATKEYARNEKKDCAHCHINHKGAGPRNERGREYEANGYRFGVKSWSSDANKERYLRARAALLSTWYGETWRLLDELEKEEKLPGGLALVEGTRRKVRIFPKAWLRAARKLLSKGDRGVPNALEKLVRLESQFPTSKEGKEAVKLLDGLAGDAKKRKLVDEARAVEKVRMVYLRGRTAHGLADWAKARELLGKVAKDPRGKPFLKGCRELLATVPEPGGEPKPGR
jgi:hypothetical protein